MAWFNRGVVSEATGDVQDGGCAPTEKVSNSIPTIGFDESNPHRLYATSVTGAGG